MSEDLARTVVLIDRLQGGDRDALDELFTRYAPRVRDMARARLGARLRRFADSGDIMQNVLMSALESIHRFEFRTEEAFLHWLGKTCSNRIADLQRHNRRKARDVEREVPLDAGDDGEGAAAERLPASQPTPSAEFAVRERAELVHDAVHRIDEGYRELVWMRDYAKMSWTEIAAELGVKPDAARKRYATAKSKLARELRAAGFGVATLGVATLSGASEASRKQRGA